MVLLDGAGMSVPIACDGQGLARMPLSFGGLVHDEMFSCQIILLGLSLTTFWRSQSFVPLSR